MYSPSREEGGKVIIYSHSSYPQARRNSTGQVLVQARTQRQQADTSREQKQPQQRRKRLGEKTSTYPRGGESQADSSLPTLSYRANNAQEFNYAYAVLKYSPSASGS